jgi:hypothetical protein
MSALADIAEIKAAKLAVPNPGMIGAPIERAAAMRRLTLLDSLAAELGRANAAYERARARFEAAAEQAGVTARLLRANEVDLDRAGRARDGEPRHVERSLLQREVERLQYEATVLAGDVKIHEARVSERTRDLEQATARLTSAREQWLALKATLGKTSTKGSRG